MRIEDFLSSNGVLVDMRASDKASLLDELSTRAATALGLDQASVRKELLKREELGSTGIGAGIAIPHARIAGLARPFGLMARLSKGIEFAAIDDKPVDVVFLLLLPTEPSADQLNALAGVTRKLRDQVRATAIRRAASDVELYAAVAAG